MELQLGLALPCNPINKGFDLNNNVYETWNHNVGCFKINKKRSFDETFENAKSDVPQTLPLLLLWNDKPNDKDDGENPKKSSSYTIDQSDGEEDCFVGWPPIKSWRKKLHPQYQGGHIDDDNDRREENRRGGLNSTYVKVKMEGMAIGRKVDLSLHQSYHTLTNTLICMFGKYQKSMTRGTEEEDRTRYTVSYQDREGDWLLVGDVPWKTFIQSVKRLKIQRSGS